MRQFARWQRLARPAAATSLVAVGVAVASLAVAAPAFAAAGPTVKAAWGTVSATGVPPSGTVKVAETGLDVPDTLTYTITPGTDPVTGLGFTDVLPTAVDAEIYDGSSVAGTYTGCGNAYSDAANIPGTSTSITISGVALTPGTTCTIVFDVAGSVAGGGADVPGTVDYTDTTLDSPETTTVTAAGSLQVLENPTVTFTAPAATGKSVYTYGELVPASYVCTETDFQYADPACAFGQDNDGAEVDNGGYLDTLEAGVNALTVTATNAGFGVSTPSVNYTVKPFAVDKLTASKTGVLSYSVALPIAGTLVTKLLDGKTVVGSLTTKVAGPTGSATSETVKPSLKLNAAGKKLLKKDKVKELKTTVEVTFTPSATAEEDSLYFGNFSPEATTVKKTGVKIK